MSARCLLFVMLCALAWGQAAAPAPGAGQNAAPAPKPEAQAPQLESLPPRPQPITASTPVITIGGLCAKPSSPDALKDPSCTTVVTKEQFDRLADTINPQMPQNTRQQLANQYAQAMVLSSVAQQRGVESNPANADVIRLEHMRVLSQLLLRDLQEEAAKVPDAEVQKYYDEHPDAFEEANLKRVFLPKNRPGAKTQPDEAALKAEADKLRARAAAGEDLDKLQKEFYEAHGLKNAPASADLKGVRRGSLPANESAICDLKPGEISQPLSEPTGYTIVQMVSKEKTPLDKAKPDIVRALTQSRMQDMIKGIAGNFKPTFNDGYFNPGGFGAAAGPGGARPTLGPPTPQPEAPAKPQPK